MLAWRSPSERIEDASAVRERAKPSDFWGEKAKPSLRKAALRPGVERHRAGSRRGRERLTFSVSILAGSSHGSSRARVPKMRAVSSPGGRADHEPPPAVRA